MLRVEAAAIASLLGAYLLLPSAFQVNVPLLPPIDKMSIAALTTFILCWMKGSQTPAQPAPFVIYLLSAAIVVSPVLTSLGNSYELQTAGGSIPGFYPLDGLKYAGRQLIFLLPFFVGMRFLSNDYGRSLLLLSVPVAMTFYSLPMLFELRMSPLLHSWVYGYFPHSFAQQYRNGGFRPVVFLSHGLEVALMTTIALLGAIILARAGRRILRAPAGAVAAYLSVLLLLCKSLGPVIYAVVFAPVIWFTRPRTWVKVACAILIFISVYPALRTAGIVPVASIARAANSISPDRSASFQMRVTNEEQLLARANEKPLFGWGTWGRNLIYDEYTGKDVSVTDGQWIIQLGTWGWFGYVSVFLLFAVSVLRAYRAIGNKVTTQSITLGGNSLLVAIYVLDMLPNGSNMVLPFLLAGSIARSAKAAAPQAGTRVDAPSTTASVAAAH